MRQDKAPRFVARRPGGSYNLTEVFALLRLSYSHGCDLINKYPEAFQVFYLSKGSPRIADATIERLMREGIPGVASFRRATTEGAKTVDPRGRRRRRATRETIGGDAA
jgi:hypothetical protein